MNAESAAKSPPSVRPKPPAAAGLEQALLRDVKVTLTATLGELSLSVSDLLGLQAGTVLTLDRLLNELLDIHLNDNLVARGEIVAVDDHFAVRIVEVGPAV